MIYRRRRSPARGGDYKEFMSLATALVEQAIGFRAGLPSPQRAANRFGSAKPAASGSQFTNYIRLIFSVLPRNGHGREPLP